MKLNLTEDQKNKLELTDNRVDFYFKVENAIIDDIELFSNIHESHLYIVLSRYCNNHQVAFPSYSTLAKLCYCSRSMIIKCMNSLESKGYINKVIRINDGHKKSNDTNLYTVNNIKEYVEKTFKKNKTDTEGGLPRGLQVAHLKDQGSLPEIPNKELLKKNNIIKKNTTTINSNIITTPKKIKTTLSKISSSILFEFLDFEEFSKINKATKKNIRKNIKDLSLEKLRDIFQQTEYAISKGNGNNFDAILYRGLIGEWNFTLQDKKPSTTKNSISTDIILDKERALWLANFSGVKSDLPLFNYTKISIEKIPVTTLSSNKSKMTKMNLFQFRNHINLLLKQN